MFECFQPKKNNPINTTLSSVDPLLFNTQRVAPFQQISLVLFEQQTLSTSRKNRFSKSQRMIERH